MPEAPMPAIRMLRMSLPGRTRSTACPIRKASDNCLVNCSIDLTIALLCGVILCQMYGVMTSKMQTGFEGESAAAAYLLGKNYEILERNYRCGRAEIDLIVKKKNWLVFVEVKTRSGDAFGFPEEFVDHTKEQLILQAAENYIYKIDWQENVRYDIIAILRGEITHFEDAFY